LNKIANRNLQIKKKNVSGLFSLLSLFWKNKSRLMGWPCCLCLSFCESSLMNFWMPEQVFMKLGMYTMAPEPISTVYIKKSHPLVGVSVCVSLLSLLGNGTVNTFPLQRTQATKNYWILHFLCSPYLIKEILCVCLYIPLLLLSNSSAKAFSRLREIFEASFSMPSGLFKWK
jgi:hypothetical protein